MAIGIPASLGANVALFSSASTIVFTLNTGVAVGDDIFVWVGCQTAGTTITVADSGAVNSYTVDVVANAVRNACGFLAHAPCTSALVSTNTITATLSGARTERLMKAHSVSGLTPSSALDKTQVGNGNIAAYDSGLTAATTQADEIVLGVACGNAVAAETQTATNGNTALFQFANSDGVSLYGVYQIVAATGTYRASANLTDSGAREWNAGVGTYKGVAANPPVVAWYVG